MAIQSPSAASCSSTAPCQTLSCRARSHVRTPACAWGHLLGHLSARHSVKQESDPVGLEQKVRSALTAACELRTMLEMCSVLLRHHDANLNHVPLPGGSPQWCPLLQAKKKVRLWCIVWMRVRVCRSCQTCYKQASTVLIMGAQPLQQDDTV